jgi:hypothetical protein
MRVFYLLSTKVIYDSTQKFQIEWATKVPWEEGIVCKDGIINMVKSKVYFLIEKKEKIMGCKWDTLNKHYGRRIVSRDMPSLGVKKGGEYIAKTCAHMKNMILYV